MKRLFVVASVILLLSSCVSHRSLDLNRLSFGMTTQEVRALAGRPNRVLIMQQTPEAYQEVLEYRTGYSEVYALEFWNNYLSGVEYLYV